MSCAKRFSEEGKKYKCKICGKGFILRDKLASHLIVHSNVKPYECKYNCGFAAKTKGNIQKHENSRKRQKGSNFQFLWTEAQAKSYPFKFAIGQSKSGGNTGKAKTDAGNTVSRVAQDAWRAMGSFNLDLDFSTQFSFWH